VTLSRNRSNGIESSEHFYNMLAIRTVGLILNGLIGNLLTRKVDKWLLIIQILHFQEKLLMINRCILSMQRKISSAWESIPKHFWKVHAHV